MGQRTTIKDIAEKAGTSVASVHRAIYGGKGISENLRNRILYEVEKNNYQMDEAASMLRRGQLHITVLLPKAADQERFYYRGLWEGVFRGAEQLKKNKVSVDFVEATCGAGRMYEALEHLYDETDENLNGLVTICDDEKSRGWLKRFMARGTRIVLIDRGVEIKGLCGCLEVSIRDMGNLAVSMLRFLMGSQERGTVALVNGSETRISYQLYASAVREKLRQLCPEMNLIILNGYEVEASREILKEQIGKGSIQGIIAGCARATYWVCDLLRELHLEKKPFLVGTDVFRELEPFFEEGILEAVTCQFHREHGEKALKILYEHLSDPRSGKAEVKKEIIPVGLVLKENYRYYMV